MDNFVEQFDQIVQLSKQNLHIVLLIIGLIWLVHFANVILGGRLNCLGIFPRHVVGLIGIFFSPWLHGNFSHLFFNSIPLFVLMSLLMLKGIAVFYTVTLIIIVLGGLGVWLFARRAFHIGASTLIMGYWSFLLITALQERTVVAVIVAVISIYYFGGLLFELLPGKKQVSWEGHIFGFSAGVAAVFIYPWLLPYVIIFITRYFGS